MPLEKRQGNRRRVHELRALGWTIAQIAREVDIAPPNVSYHLRRPVDDTMATRPRKDAGTTRHRCRCGVPIASSLTRCTDCQKTEAGARRRQREAERTRILIAHAEDTGLVPTVAEAQRLLAVGRSRAGEELLRVFGRDDRECIHRRREPRPYQPLEVAS